VQNPVALLTVDNNGVILQLPSATSGGSVSVDGQLILGINTRSNNVPIGATAYPADPTKGGTFITTYRGIPDSNSFIDSGSNGLFFNDSGSIPLCSINSNAPGWFCPAFTRNLSATNRGYTGTPSGTVPFQIGNAVTLVNSPNYVFAELGGTNIRGAGFDWGLPFFLGRSVYVGIEGRSSGSLGTGPFWAY
jgi:hypothetical protein